jgi:hypothetical protein
MRVGKTGHVAHKQTSFRVTLDNNRKALHEDIIPRF